MKRNYVRPVFIAETYTFRESIAACDLKPGDPSQEALYIDSTTHFCTNPSCGHSVNKKPMAPGITLPTTIFSDGGVAHWDGNKAKIIGCNYDWNIGKPSTFQDYTGKPVVEFETTGLITNDFGVEPSPNTQHAPAYGDEKLMYS